MAESHGGAKGAAAHTEAEGGQKAPFPPFQKDTFASQLIWITLAFVALYLLMARVALPRIGSILTDRKQHIEGDIAQADRLKRDADAALAAYEKSLTDARGRAQALASETRAREAAAAESARKALDAKLNATIAGAEKTIAARRSDAMTNVRGIAVDAAAAIVQRLTGSAPASREVEAAVADVLKR
jgi:F-type H+-transporting ATPase subunit b